MSTWSIILIIYAVLAVVWSVVVITQRSFLNKEDWIIFFISIPVAPICLLVGFATFIVSVLHPKKIKLRHINKGFAGSAKPLTEEEIAAPDKSRDKNGMEEDMEDDTPYCRYYHEQKLIEKFLKARREKDWALMEECFLRDARLVRYNNNTISCVHNIIDFWDRFIQTLERRHIDISSNISMCMYYNMPAVIDQLDGYSPNLLLFRFVRMGYSFSGLKIADMTYMPNPPHEFNFGLMDSAPFAYESFKKYLREKVVPLPDHLMCKDCGETSENLDWYSFYYNEKNIRPWYRGRASICPKCGKIVETIPEEKVDNDNPSARSINSMLVKNGEWQPKLGPELVLECYRHGAPLEGTDYVSGLDPDLKVRFAIEREYEGVSIREAAEKCDLSHMHLIRNMYPDHYRKILAAYAAAYKDGVPGVANCIGVLLGYNLKADRASEYFKEAAEKGDPHASLNNFVMLWYSERYQEAVDYALSVNAPDIYMTWNIAILYVLGPALTGNPLPSDLEKGREYLERIKAMKVNNETEYETKEAASKLLSGLDDYNLLEVTAKDFFRELDGIVEHAKEADGEVRKSVMNEYLGKIRFPEDKTLMLHLASLEENGHGDICRFYFKGEDLYEGDGTHELEDKFHGPMALEVETEKSDMGVWHLYLLRSACHLMPTAWHGAYNVRRFVFREEDLRWIPAIAQRDLDTVTRGEDLAPRITWEGDSAYVSCVYWNDWHGLSRENVRFDFDGNRVVGYEDLRDHSIYQYRCSIMF